MFECPKCQKGFRDKFSLESHLIQTPTCNANLTIFSRKSIFDDDIECKWCRKVFTKKSSLISHLENINSKCYIERSVQSEAKQKEAMSDDEKRKILEELKQIKNSISHLTNNDLLAIKNSISNIEKNGTNNNVIIVKPGKESIKHITKDIMLKLLGSYSFIEFSCELVKITYFNLKVRKNCGWCIAYPKNSKAGVQYNHEISSFERISTTDIIDDRFANLLNLLQPFIGEINKEDELLDNLNQYQKRNIKEFYAHFGMTSISTGDPKLYEAIHDVSYNYKTVPMAAWRDQGLNANHLSIKFH
jgi:hypothetical protein